MLIKRKTLFAGLLLAGSAIFTSCSDSESATGNQSARLQVSMTDAPDPNVREVWVDIQSIQVNTSDSANSGWTTLSGAHPGVYNLLALTNGRDTLLADAEIPAGHVSQMRMVLGPNNYLILNDGSRVALETPSAQQSGLKLPINQQLGGGLLYRLVLDFDAGRSVVKAGNSGRYILKPVIRIISLTPSGGIVNGVVTPIRTRTAVYAIQGSDTVASTYTDTLNGRYSIRDIRGGAYNFSYVPNDTLLHSTSRSVNVTLGQTTVVDTVRLQ